MHENKEEIQYLKLLKNIIDNGSERTDRTGIGTYSIFGTQLRFSLKNNQIPLLTTKKMFTRGIIEELLFFIRGDTNTKKLEEIGINIWKGNTTREFLDKRGLFSYKEGEMGPMYGYQWRKFGESDIINEYTYDGVDRTIKGIDQLQNAVNLIKNDPNSRRIVVTAYNPLDLNKGVLEPCHLLYQFYVDKGWLSCQLYQRTVDSFLGLPFNIVSYSILTHLIAKITNLKAKELIFIGGDTHIYKNHLQQINEQIIREPFEFPQLKIKKEIYDLQDIEKMSFTDFEIDKYQFHPAIKAEMAI